MNDEMWELDIDAPLEEVRASAEKKASALPERLDDEMFCEGFSAAHLSVLAGC